MAKVVAGYSWVLPDEFVYIESPLKGRGPKRMIREGCLRRNWLNAVDLLENLAHGNMSHVCPVLVLVFFTRLAWNMSERSCNLF